MYHAWSVICSDTTIDAASNNISLFKVIESIAFSVNEVEARQLREQEGHLPLPINFVIVTMWWRSDVNEPEKSASRYVLLTPSQEERELLEIPVDLMNHTRTRMMGRLQGFPFFESGVYHIMVQTKENDTWQSVASVPLEVIQNATEPPNE
jgi:hypothetical protein